MQNALNAAWWPQPTQMQPLEVVRVTLENLERGTPTPQPAATIMATALRQYLAGKHDITGNLGLRPRCGGTHETPMALEQATQRNNAIRAIYEALPEGTKKAKAEQTAQLLRVMPDPSITEAEIFGYAMRLHLEFGGSLPKSVRQVMRVVAGETVADKKKM